MKVMIREVKPFDDHQWAQLQEDMKRPLADEQKEKIAKIRQGMAEVSNMVAFEL